MTTRAVMPLVRPLPLPLPLSVLLLLLVHLGCRGSGNGQTPTPAPAPESVPVAIECNPDDGEGACPQGYACAEDGEQHRCMRLGDFPHFDAASDASSPRH